MSRCCTVLSCPWRVKQMTHAYWPVHWLKTSVLPGRLMQGFNYSFAQWSLTGTQPGPAPKFKIKASVDEVRFKFSLRQHHAEQTRHRLGSHSDECAAEGQHDHLLLTATECRSVWHRRNTLERRLKEIHLKTHKRQTPVLTVIVSAGNDTTNNNKNNNQLVLRPFLKDNLSKPASEQSAVLDFHAGPGGAAYHPTACWYLHGSRQYYRNGMLKVSR